MQEKKEEDLQQVLNKIFEVGIDEVGRGAVFGPVFSAAVVLNKKNKSILKKTSKSRELEEIAISIEENANYNDEATNKANENEELASSDQKDEIEITDEIKNARKKRRRSSAGIE